MYVQEAAPGDLKKKKNKTNKLHFLLLKKFYHLNRFIFVIWVDIVKKNTTPEIIIINDNIRKETKNSLDHKYKEMTNVKEKRNWKGSDSTCL